MNVQHRIEILEKLGNYILSESTEWKLVIEKALLENTWFVKEFVELATKNIAIEYLGVKNLQQIAAFYSIPPENKNPLRIGIVMAGNIPLAGIHDLVCTFLSGHKQSIKLSSKDQVLLKHLVEKMTAFNSGVSQMIHFAEMLKGCEAYIATGSNNSSRYFEYYFGKYPSIIRKNRTSVAILDGSETNEDLEKLADDVYQYFGLGCRNVTKMYVPEQFDFIPLLNVFRKYTHLSNHNKYRNNYDYQLAVLIINKRFYMTNESIILVEEKDIFSPISQLNYEYYTNKQTVIDSLEGNSSIQCIVGKGFNRFGNSQKPSITDFADGVDTLKFLLAI